MNKLNELQNKNSEEVKDILERMPTHFARIITMLLIFIALLILLFGKIIKYPDIVTGGITLTYSNNPVKLISKNNGILEIRNFEKFFYHEGEYIAWIRSAADVTHMKIIKELAMNHTVEKLLNQPSLISLFPIEVSLGEINQIYHTFLLLLTRHIVLIEKDIFNNEIANLTLQINNMKEQLSNSFIIRDFRKQILDSQHKNFEKDSIIFSDFENAGISEMDFENSRISYLRVRESYQSILNDITGFKIQIAAVQSRLNQMKLAQLEREQESIIELYLAYNNLLDQINAWEERYVFKSPFEGNVDFLNFWRDGQYIGAGEEFCIVIPVSYDKIGQMFLPSHGSGKVAIGQDVIIKLDNYPFLEYGALRGKVMSISQISGTVMLPNVGHADMYRVEVILQDDGKTNFGAILELNPQTKGTAEIITKQRVLLERLFDNLRYVTN